MRALKTISIVLLALMSTVALAAHHANTSQKTEIKLKQAQAKRAQPKKESHWNGSHVQLGLVYNTGNTNDTNLNGGFFLRYQKDPWLNTLLANGQLVRSDGQTTQEKYFAMDQVNYMLKKERNSFIFSNLKYNNDRFSPYTYQSVFALGYGRDLVKTQKFHLSAQVGPGLRHNKVQQTKEISNNVIGTSGINMAWQITDNLKFTEEAGYDFGKPFNYLKSVTAITNKISHNLAIQLSYTAEYYSNIPLGSTRTKNLDTTTNIAIVYNFT